MVVDTTLAATGTRLKRAAIALFVLCVLLAAALSVTDLPSEAVDFLVVPFALIGMLLHFKGRQYAAKSLARASPSGGSRPHVLYLRSFDTDPSTQFKKLASGFTSEEEQLGDVLGKFGDLIAIGRPGEPLPLPGAERIYAKESEWRAVVLDRMRTARLVVIRAGTGPALAWEVGQAFAVLRPKQMVFLVLNQSLQDYRVFADQVRERARIALPTIEPCGPMWTFADARYNSTKALPGFIAFSDDWVPAFLPLPFTLTRVGYGDLKKPFNAALRPMFERHGLEWHPRGRFG